MQLEKLLILHYENFSEKLDNLFRRMDKSPAFLELFIQDPSGILAKSVFSSSRRFTTAHLNQSNRLLFAVLSNPKFLKWSARFQKEVESRIKKITQVRSKTEKLQLFFSSLDKSKLYPEIIQGIMDSMDKETLYSILAVDPDKFPPFTEANTEPDPLGPVADDDNVAVFIITIIAIAVLLAIVAIPGRGAFTDAISRYDLSRISAFLAERLSDRANQVRKSGQLTSFDAITKGQVI